MLHPRLCSSESRTTTPTAALCIPPSAALCAPPSCLRPGVPVALASAQVAAERRGLPLSSAGVAGGVAGGIAVIESLAIAGNISWRQHAPSAQELQTMCAALGACQQFFIPSRGAALSCQRLVQQPTALRRLRRVLGPRYVLEGIEAHAGSPGCHDAVAGDGWRCCCVAADAGDEIVQHLGTQRGCVHLFLRLPLLPRERGTATARHGVSMHAHAFKAKTALRLQAMHNNTEPRMLTFTFGAHAHWFVHTEVLTRSVCNSSSTLHCSRTWHTHHARAQALAQTRVHNRACVRPRKTCSSLKTATDGRG